MSKKLKMKNKKGNVALTVFAVFAIIVVLIGVGFLVYKVTSQSAVNGGGASGGTPNVPSQGAGTNNVAPSVGLSFTNALTGQSITATAVNYLNKDTGKLMGSSPTFSNGQRLIPMVNASGYIIAEQPEIDIVNGPQTLSGTLYQFANATIQLYDSTGVKLIGGKTLASSVANDTVITATANHKLVLTGKTYKSTGRLLIIYEASNTTSLQQATLTLSGSQAPLSSIAVPNCYSNVLTNPYKTAWEVPAIIGGTQTTYNLQVASLNGNAVSGQGTLTIYNEQDAVDSGTGAYLTSRICDSLNTGYSIGNIATTWYYNG